MAKDNSPVQKNAWRLSGNESPVDEWNVNLAFDTTAWIIHEILNINWIWSMNHTPSETQLRLFREPRQFN